MEIEPLTLDSTAFAKGRLRVDAHSFSRAMACVSILRERAHRPSLRRDARAGFDRRGQCSLVRALFERRPLEMTTTGEPPERAAMHGPDGAFEVLGTRGRRRMEDELTFGPPSKDTVEKDDVEVHIQVEASAKRWTNVTAPVRTPSMLVTPACFAEA